MRLSVLSSTGIKVTWGRPVDCRDWNGVITGYSVRYGEEGTSEGDMAVKTVSGVIVTIISGLAKETVYTVEVAAVTSAGTGVYSQPQIIETPDSEYELFCSFNLHSFILLYTDVYFSLNDDIIPNHGHVDISDIGSTDDTALLCHSNCPSSPGSIVSGGDWFAPDFTRVNEDDVSGFTRNRGSMVVRLKRTTGTPHEGIYWCSIQDAASVQYTLYVGLYNSGRGIYVIIFNQCCMVLDQ